MEPDDREDNPALADKQDPPAKSMKSTYLGPLDNEPNVVFTKHSWVKMDYSNYGPDHKHKTMKEPKREAKLTEFRAGPKINHARVLAKFDSGSSTGSFVSVYLGFNQYPNLATWVLFEGKVILQLLRSAGLKSWRNEHLLFLIPKSLLRTSCF